MKNLAVKKKDFLINDLSKALEKEEFSLVFQSKVETQSKKIMGAEVLLRWCHPEYGLIPTEQWVLLAEANNFLPNITRWLAANVIKHLAKDCFQNISLSMNVSPNSLDNDFADFVLSTLRSYDVPASRLMLEITESAEIINMKKLVLVVKKLRLAGVKIALDDFGAGFSSMKYLMEIPVDSVKIDKEFVQKAVGSETAKKIFHSLVDLAHSIKTQVIVEGVETEEHYTLAQSTKTKFVQGFLFSKPVCFNEFKMMIEKT